MFSLGTKRLSDEYLHTKYSTPLTEYLPFEGGKLRVEDQGQGPVIVLIHGLMANYKAWDRWMSELVKCNRVIRLDLPGWGLSDSSNPKVYDPQMHNRAVLEVLRIKHVDKATLVGHSFGGYVAWNLAADYPQLVERLVIVNGLSFPQRIRFDAKLLSWPIIRKYSRRMAPRPIVDYAINSMLANKRTLRRADRQMYFDFLMRRGAKRTMSDAINWYLHYPGIHQQPDSRLTNLKQPLMTLWGEKDVWASYRDAGALWPKYYPSAKHVVYKDAGHLVVDEQPQDSLSHLLDFLATTNSELDYS